MRSKECRSRAVVFVFIFGIVEYSNIKRRLYYPIYLGFTVEVDGTKKRGSTRLARAKYSFCYLTSLALAFITFYMHRMVELTADSRRLCTFGFVHILFLLTRSAVSFYTACVLPSGFQYQVIGDHLSYLSDAPEPTIISFSCLCHAVCYRAHRCRISLLIRRTRA